MDLRNLSKKSEAQRIQHGLFDTASHVGEDRE
jgi:hypothetical protein